MGVSFIIVFGLAFGCATPADPHVEHPCSPPATLNGNGVSGLGVLGVVGAVGAIGSPSARAYATGNPCEAR